MRRSSDQSAWGLLTGGRSAQRRCRLRASWAAFHAAARLAEDRKRAKYRQGAYLVPFAAECHGRVIFNFRVVIDLTLIVFDDDFWSCRCEF